MKRWLPLAAGLLVAYVLGLWSAPGPDPAELRTIVDTVPPTELLERVEDLEIEAHGWKAMAEAVQVRPPRLIIRTDTLVQAPDTVFRLIAARGGELSWAPLIRADSLWSPELHVASVADCDDGWSVGPSGLVCDRARLGHLWLGASTLGALSARWAPTFRSRWSVEAGWGERPFVGVALRVW